MRRAVHAMWVPNGATEFIGGPVYQQMLPFISNDTGELTGAIFEADIVEKVHVEELQLALYADIAALERTWGLI
jgi:hypothetical protein